MSAQPLSPTDWPNARVRWPNVPIVFCETRSLAEEWTYRYLAAAHSWAVEETEAIKRTGDLPPKPRQADMTTEPKPADIRAWARTRGIDVPDRGRIPLAVRQAFEIANPG